MVVRDLLDRDAALGNFGRSLFQEGAEVALGGGNRLDGQEPAVDAEAGGGGHGVDLAALAAGEDAAEVERGNHDLALGRAEFLFGEDFLVPVEREHEGGHLFERVDAAVGDRAVCGQAVHADIEPHDAVVAAADGVALAALADDGVVGAEFSVAGDPTSTESAVGLLVGGERDLDVKVGLAAGGPQRLQGEDDAGDGALHV